jgi:hypothetical protein
LATVPGESAPRYYISEIAGKNPLMLLLLE